MNTRERIDADLIQAMRDKDELKRDTLRMVVSAFKNRRIELQEDLSEDEHVAMIRRAVKQRHEAAAEYTKGARAELADKEAAEAKILEVYLPQQLDEATTRDIVAGLIGELGITDRKQLGKLMKEAMARHKGQIDGKLVNRLAGELFDAQG